MSDQRAGTHGVVIDAYTFPMIRWARKVLHSGLDGYANVPVLDDRTAADLGVRMVLAREAGG